MNLISFINLISSIIIILSIIFIIVAVIKKKIKWHIGMFLIICLAIVFFVAFSNVLEHSQLTDFFDYYEEYLEILIIPYFLLFIYGISANNELNHRKRNEKKLLHSLEEREILLKEVHHRIKNNLQTIVSLITIQNQTIKDKNTKKHLNTIVNRVVAMGLLHKTLYQTEDFTNIDLGNYFLAIMQQLKDFFGTKVNNIKLKIDPPSFYTNIDTAIPCGLIVNEIVSNSFKYAFNKKNEGEISIIMTMECEDLYRIIVKDNGCAIPDQIDFETNCGLGLQIISMLVKQLKGEVTLIRNNGTEYSLLIKKIIK